MNITRLDTPNKWSGGNRCEVIIIHWWGAPSTKPTLKGVVNHLLDPQPSGNPASAVSAHYVVSGDSVTQFADETDRCWHAMRANDFGIGIEVDPNTPGNTYKTLGELVRAIRSRHGNIPLKRHSDYVNTACLPLDSTELLTQHGWKPLGEVKVGDSVAQWKDGIISFEKVLEKVAPYEAKVYKRRKLEATADHRIIHHTQMNKTWRIDEWGSLLSSKGRIYIPCSGRYNAKGLPMSDDLLKFLVWVQADGCYMYDIKKDGSKGFYGIEFHFRKQRKIGSLSSILKGLGYDTSTKPRSDGTTSIRVYGRKVVEDCESWLCNKSFMWNLLEMSYEQFDIFVSTLLEADGCTANSSYSSSAPINVDIVQAIMCLNGQTSNVYSVGRQNRLFFKSKYFTIGHDSLGGERTTKVSCVTVPSSSIVIRQHGQVLIVGNCPGTIDLGRIEQEAKGLDPMQIQNRHQARLWYVATLGREYNSISDAEADGIIGKNIEQLVGQFIYGEKNPTDRVEWHERNQKAQAFDALDKQLEVAKATQKPFDPTIVDKIKKELADVDEAVKALKG